jgi:GR25 family glycosyltransferase involved in LPS biosynthesis
MIVCICVPERKEHMTKTFRQWGIKNVTFFDAYLKKDYTHQHFINIGFLNKDYNDYLNLGRICCHYSALSVYKSFLNSSSERLLVFEDDLRTDTYKNVEHFNSILTPVLQTIPDNWDYLNFSK